jgi:hypothetical protein
MTSSELKNRIQNAVRKIYGVSQPGGDTLGPVPDELTKFPELSKVLTDLLTEDFKVFVENIDWVAPKPTTFRINLKNGQSFYLIYTLRSWIAQIEGKKYYLLNLNERENATNAISRILRFGAKVTAEEADAETSTGKGGKKTPTPSPPSSPTPLPSPSPETPETPEEV